MTKTWGPAAFCLLLTGCAAVSGYPRPILSERQELAEIAAYLEPAAIADYEKCDDKVLCRNTIVDARLRAVDVAFYRFQRKIYAQDSRVALGSNMLTLALDSAAAVTSTGGLALGAGLLVGGRDAFQKQIRSVSLPLLFEQMIAKRREVLLRIRLGQRMPASGYTLFQALDDVSEYELAGSIPAAAAELGASVGQSARTAQIQLDALRAASLAAAGAVAVPAAAPVPAESPGTLVYSNSSGTANVATVVPDAKAGAATPPVGSVIYTTDTGPANAASVIPVPVAPAPAPPTPTAPAPDTSATGPATEGEARTSKAPATAGAPPASAPAGTPMPKTP